MSKYVFQWTDPSSWNCTVSRLSTTTGAPCTTPSLRMSSAVSFPQTIIFRIESFQSALGELSHASPMIAQPRLTGVPTGSSIVSSPVTTCCSPPSQASLSPVFQSATWCSIIARIWS